LQTFFEENKSRTDTVKDYVERAVEVETQESREEIEDRERRKTSIIVHGLLEYSLDDKDIRSAVDTLPMELVINMLEELDGKDVQITKLIRLGKFPDGVQSTTNTGSSSTEPKPRPVKLVLSSENEKNKLLKLSKKLKTIKEGEWKKVFLHQDLTVKEREARKALVLEVKRRVALGEQDLANHQREDCIQNTKTLNALRCFYTNANSLIRKMDEFKFRILRSDYHSFSYRIMGHS